jgi:membrane protease YdiL (CAAX protease family)
MPESPGDRTAGPFLRIWVQIPAIFRALVLGVLVAWIGLTATNWLFAANDDLWPNAPWSAVAVVLFFWVYIQYFSGRWWPHQTAEARRRVMGWRHLSMREWRYAAIAGVAMFVYVPSSVALSFRFMNLSPDILDRSSEISGMPLWIAMSFIVALSISAGVWEETAFRGYFQNIVTERYGHRLAILASAALFTVAHFNHDSGPARAVMLFTGGIMFGYLSYVARSIIPVVIPHVLSDIFTGMLTRKIFDPDRIIVLTPISETGVDAHLVTSSIVTVACVLVFVLSTRKLARLASVRTANG